MKTVAVVQVLVGLVASIPTIFAGGYGYYPYPYPPGGPSMPSPPAGTIVEIAAGDDTFSTLVAAVQAAGLVDVLNGAGSYTVFAPTNDAFDALPDGALDYLLDNPSALAEVLQYHVLGTEVFSGQLYNGLTVPTLQGDTVKVTFSSYYYVPEDNEWKRDIFVNDAQVIMPDIDATNGVIHVIDAVLLPPGFTIPDPPTPAPMPPYYYPPYYGYPGYGYPGYGYPGYGYPGYGYPGFGSGYYGYPGSGYPGSGGGYYGPGFGPGFYSGGYGYGYGYGYGGGYYYPPIIYPPLPPSPPVPAPVAPPVAPPVPPPVAPPVPPPVKCGKMYSGKMYGSGSCGGKMYGGKMYGSRSSS